jgi:glucose/arabinose dehydrogenase
MIRTTAALAALVTVAFGGSAASAAPTGSASPTASAVGSPAGASSRAALVLTPGFTRRVVATGLGDPYEIVWGPDAQLWVTEKSGLKVTRVNSTTGTKSTAVSIPQAHHSPGGQDGVLGLALHPQLLKGTGNDFVYVSYSYLTTTPAPVTGERRRLRIVRFTLQRPDAPAAQSQDPDHRSAGRHRSPVRAAALRAGQQAALHDR